MEVVVIGSVVVVMGHSVVVDEARMGGIYPGYMSAMHMPIGNKNPQPFSDILDKYAPNFTLLHNLTICRPNE